MFESVIAQIETAEERLRLAMLGADIEVLDSLISPNLLFTTHFGAVITKEDDIETYRSGALKFHSIVLSEQKLLVLGGIVCVCVRAKLSGVFGGSPFEDDIRFLRVWHLTSSKAWQIVSGQATAMRG